MDIYKVPYGTDVSVSFRKVGDTIFIDVHAPLYVRKEWSMSHQYSDKFSIGDILRDRVFQTVMLNCYGV